MPGTWLTLKLKLALCPVNSQKAFTQVSLQLCFPVQAQQARIRINHIPRSQRISLEAYVGRENVALSKSGFGAGTKGGVRIQFGVLSSTSPSTPGLFVLLASRQGFPKLSQRAGLGSPAPGNPWSLQAGVKSGRGRGPRHEEAPPGDRAHWPPPAGFRCHVTASQVFQVWGWRVRRSPPDRTERWWGSGGSSGCSFSLGELPAPAYPHNCATWAPHTPALLQRGAGGGWRGLSAVRLEGSPYPHSRQGARPRGSAPALGRPWPGPSAHLQGCGGGETASAGRLRAERKPRAQTGRGGWCERLGPVPARRGWNTMSRAGGRAGSENSLTQQLVLSLRSSRSTRLRWSNELPRGPRIWFLGRGVIEAHHLCTHCFPTPNTFVQVKPACNVSFVAQVLILVSWFLAPPEFWFQKALTRCLGPRSHPGARPH
ncbi:uncharacterized protein LOC116871756 [Lontra canadensis]|uniref:uncharacterized protein LOC116871756 n=1 Tax=Lontra canadensis TaxID=76717 RepID=UPI0013F32734|nr:uncharacterized protein LOC116871756 [Lontra canadensis]